jgi:hypothetical protein
MHPFMRVSSSVALAALFACVPGCSSGSGSGDVSSSSADAITVGINDIARFYSAPAGHHAFVLTPGPDVTNLSSPSGASQGWVLESGHAFALKALPDGIFSTPLFNVFGESIGYAAPFANGCPPSLVPLYQLGPWENFWTTNPGEVAYDQRGGWLVDAMYCVLP